MELNNEYLQNHEEFCKKITELNKVSNLNEWQKSRSTTIGGSEVGTILDLNKYQTQLDLWEIKTQRKPLFEGNVATEWGHRLEQVVADKTSEVLNLNAKEIDHQFKNPNYPMCAGYVDRLLVDNSNKNVVAVLECKTSSSFAYEWGNDCYYNNGVLNEKQELNVNDIPPSYYAQVQYYMFLTGIHDAFLSVLIDGRDFRIYKITYSEKFVNLILQKVVDFWWCVINDIQPPLLRVDLERADQEENTAITVKDTNTDIYNTLQQIQDLKKQQKELKQKQEELENDLILFLGTNNILLDEKGKILATFKSQKRVTFDSALFKDQHTDLYKEYLKETTTKRSLSVKFK